MQHAAGGALSSARIAVLAVKERHGMSYAICFETQSHLHSIARLAADQCLEHGRMLASEQTHLARKALDTRQCTVPHDAYSDIRCVSRTTMCTIKQSVQSVEEGPGGYVHMH